MATTPIERDEGYDRTYIPLPGGWEIQTKGKGSTFRICDTKTGDRLPIIEQPYLFELLEKMGREIHAACAAPQGGGQVSTQRPDAREYLRGRMAEALRTILGLTCSGVTGGLHKSCLILLEQHDALPAAPAVAPASAVGDSWRTVASSLHAALQLFRAGRPEAVDLSSQATRMYARALAAIAAPSDAQPAQALGTITGWRMEGNLRVFTASREFDGPPAEYVALADYRAAQPAQAVTDDDVADTERARKWDESIGFREAGPAELREVWIHPSGIPIQNCVADCGARVFSMRPPAAYGHEWVQFREVRAP